MSTLSGAASVIAAARSKGGFGPPARKTSRFKSFTDEIEKHRVEREPAQHVLGPSHVGAYAQQAKPAHKGPSAPAA